MQIQVKILDISKEVWNKTSKGGYGKTTVQFQGDKGPQQRNFVSYDEIYKDVRAMKVGATYEVRIEKEGDYWNWKEIKEIAGSDVINNPPKTTNERASSSGNSWDERLKFDKEKQILIVRQSQLTNAIAALGPGKSLREYYDFADGLVSYVNYGNPNKDVGQEASDSETPVLKGRGRPRKEAVDDIE